MKIFDGLIAFHLQMLQMKGQIKYSTTLLKYYSLLFGAIYFMLQGGGGGGCCCAFQVVLNIVM